jgi:hypothetical protein
VECNSESRRGDYISASPRITQAFTHSLFVGKVLGAPSNVAIDCTIVTLAILGSNLLASSTARQLCALTPLCPALTSVHQASESSGRVGDDQFLIHLTTASANAMRASQRMSEATSSTARSSTTRTRPIHSQQRIIHYGQRNYQASTRRAPCPYPSLMCTVMHLLRWWPRGTSKLANRDAGSDAGPERARHSAFCFQPSGRYRSHSWFRRKKEGVWKRVRSTIGVLGTIPGH